MDSGPPVDSDAECARRSVVSRRQGCSRGLIPTFRKGFAPRIGIAWDPTGKSKWLVTSAYGLFYEPYYTGQGGPLQSPISAPPYLQTQQISLTQTTFLNFPDPYFGNPPPDGTFATPLTNLTLAPNLPLPYSQDRDLNIQRSLGEDLLLEMGYVGTKGRSCRACGRNPAIYTPGFFPQWVVNPLNDFQLGQRGQSTDSFRMHARSCVSSVYVLVHRSDRGYCELFVQCA